MYQLMLTVLLQYDIADQLVNYICYQLIILYTTRGSKIVGVLINNAHPVIMVCTSLQIMN